MSLCKCICILLEKLYEMLLTMQSRNGSLIYRFLRKPKVVDINKHSNSTVDKQSGFSILLKNDSKRLTTLLTCGVP